MGNISGLWHFGKEKLLSLFFCLSLFETEKQSERKFKIKIITEKLKVIGDILFILISISCKSNLLEI